MRSFFGKLFTWLKTNQPVFWQVVGPLILIGKLLVRGEVVFWGASFLQFSAWRWTAWNLIKAGEIPIWNPLNGMGAPLFANYQSALLYPPNILIWISAAIADLPGINFAQTVLVMVHLILGGIGFVVLTRKLGFSKLGQTISGLTYSLSTYQISRISFLPMNAVLAWLPWLLYFEYLFVMGVKDGNTKQQRKGIIWFIISLSCLLLAGHAQLAWYCILILMIWLVLWILPVNDLKRTIKTFSRLAGAFLIGFSIAAVQLIPTAEYLLSSQRASAVELKYALNYSFWPWRMLTLLAANLFGHPGNGNYWVTADNYWEDAIYIGILPVVSAFILVVLFLFKRTRVNQTYQRIIYLSIGIISFGFLLALGRYTPIYPWLYAHVPTFAMFQAPARWLIWPVVGFTFLAGISVEFWQTPKGRWLYWSRLSMAGACAIFIGSLLVVQVTGRGIQATYLRSFAELGAILLILAILNLTKPETSNKQSLWSMFVILFLIVDLVYANWGSIPGIPNFSSKTFERSEAAQQAGRLFMTDIQVEDLTYRTYFPFNSYQLSETWKGLFSIVMPNTNLYTLQAMANNFDPFVPAIFADWMAMDTLQSAHPDLETMRLMGISAYQKSSDGEIKNQEFVRLDGGNRFHFFTCWMNETVQLQMKQDVSKLIQDQKILSKIVVDREDIPAACMINQGNQAIEVKTSSSTMIQINVENTQPGWFVQSDTFYPGWTAVVDGNRTGISLVDGIFRGVFLNPGKHEVVFKYQPLSITIGMLFTIVGIISMLVIICRSRRTVKNGSS